MEALIPRSRAEIVPGVVHLPDWLDLAGRRRLVAACREWSRPPAGLRAARLPSGAVMSVQTVCLGWHWYPHRYSRTVDDGDGAPVVGRVARGVIYRSRFQVNCRLCPAGVSRFESSRTTCRHSTAKRRDSLHARERSALPLGQ